MAIKREHVSKEIVSLTTQLIKFKTTKDNASERKKIIAFVEKFFPKKDYSIKRFEQNNKESLVIEPKLNGKLVQPETYFLCHADVVEAEPKQFKPYVKAGKLYGRGSYDMKGGLAIAMLVVKHSHGKAALMITTDEEIGGKEGSGMLSHRYKPKFLVATEPTNLNLTLKEKGVMWVKLVADGKSCHGSEPWNGDNAADKLVRIYSDVRKRIDNPKKESWKTTMNLGLISAGKAPNIVPDRAEMTLDIRYVENTSSDPLLTRSCEQCQCSIEEFMQRQIALLC